MGASRDFANAKVRAINKGVAEKSSWLMNRIKVSISKMLPTTRYHKIPIKITAKPVKIAIHKNGNRVGRRKNSLSSVLLTMKTLVNAIRAVLATRIAPTRCNMRSSSTSLIKGGIAYTRSRFIPMNIKIATAQKIK